MSVVVLGSANMDLVVEATRWPALGETTSGTAFALAHGGKGANQAVAAARLGAATSFVGRVGADAYGDQLREALRLDGIDVTGLAQDPEVPSGVAVILVDPDGGNRIVVVPGANGLIGDPELARLDERLAHARVLLLQLEIPMAVVVAAVEAAAAHGVRVLLDPAPVPADGLPPALYAPHVVLTPNEVEAEQLTGCAVGGADQVERAARTLIARGAGGVVLKLGARGVAGCDGGPLLHVAADAVDAVDTVGAGDAVNGALAAELAAGRELADGLAFAVAAASLSTTRHGAQTAMPRRDEVRVPETGGVGAYP